MNRSPPGLGALVGEASHRHRSHQPTHALSVAELPVAVPVVELGQVAVQVDLGDVVVGAVQRPLELAKEVLGGLLVITSRPT